MKESPTPRKAYSSPVQRTRSMDTELDQCTVTETLQSNAEAKPSHITETNSGINRDATESVKVVQNAEEIAKNGLSAVKTVVKSHNGMNVVNCGLLKNKRNLQKMQEESLQKDPSHVIRGKKENSLECSQKISYKAKTQLQPSCDLATDTVKVSRTKKRNTYKPDQSKSSKSVAEKENSSQDPQLQDNVFGPELDISTLKSNTFSSDKTENYLQDQNDKSVNLIMKKDSKQVSKNDISIKQSSLTGDPLQNGNWESVCQNKMVVENVTEPKLQNLMTAQHNPYKDNFSIMDATTETKTKLSLQQTKQSNETAEKYVNVRKIPKSEEEGMVSATEERSSSVQSILTVLNSLAGKGNIIYYLFTGCIQDCTISVSLTNTVYWIIFEEGIHIS